MVPPGRAGDARRGGAPPVSLGVTEGRDFRNRFVAARYDSTGVEGSRQEGHPAMVEDRYLTQSEAAALCGCDYSTIKRHRHRGSFPGLRRRTDATGTYEIPLSDLVAAGLFDPDRQEPIATPEQLTEELHQARLEVERLRGRLEAMANALEDRRDEVAYLRRALDAAHSALGVGRAA